MGDWVDVSGSSWLEAAKYDEATAEAEGRASMFLRTKAGQEYEIFDVSPRVWQGFIDAPSRGRYFWRRIQPYHVKRMVG